MDATIFIPTIQEGDKKRIEQIKHFLTTIKREDKPIIWSKIIRKSYLAHP